MTRMIRKLHAGDLNRIPVTAKRIKFSFYVKNVENGAFMRYNIKKFILWEE